MRAGRQSSLRKALGALDREDLAPVVTLIQRATPAKNRSCALQRRMISIFGRITAAMQMKLGEDFEHLATFGTDHERAVFEFSRGDENIPLSHQPVTNQATALEDDHRHPAIVPMKRPVLVGRQSDIGNQELERVALRSEREEVVPDLPTDDVGSDLPIRAVPAAALYAIEPNAGTELLKWSLRADHCPLQVHSGIFCRLI